MPHTEIETARQSGRFRKLIVVAAAEEEIEGSLKEIGDCDQIGKSYTARVVFPAIDSRDVYKRQV